MVDSKYSLDNFKTLKISIGTIMKDPEMLRFIPDHLKAIKMSKTVVRKLPFIITYVPNCFNTKQMFHKVIIKNCKNVNVYS